MVAGVTQDITYETADCMITITYSPVSTVERKYSVEGDTLQIQNASDGYKTYTKTLDGGTSTRDLSDAELAEAAKDSLIGTWSYVGMEEVERLIFDEDGTGTYMGLSDRNYSFTYAVSIVHKEYNNGDPYIDTVLTISYNTGESEEIVIRFREDTQELTFSTADGGSYSGSYMNYFGGWKKQ